MLIAQRPGLTEDQVSEFRSRFVIEPLEPGFGYTIGKNSVRRTLLSSIPGAAITSIRIEGSAARVLHRPRGHRGCHRHHPEPQGARRLLRARRAGADVTCASRAPGPVTAADIAPPAGVEVHKPRPAPRHPEQQGQAGDGADGSRRGRGYVSAAQKQAARPGDRPDPHRLDLLAGDAGHPTRSRRPGSSQRTDFDKLILDVGDQAEHAAPGTRWPAAGKTLVELFGPGPGAERGRRGPSTSARRPPIAALAADPRACRSRS